MNRAIAILMALVFAGCAFVQVSEDGSIESVRVGPNTSVVLIPPASKPNAPTVEIVTEGATQELWTNIACLLSNAPLIGSGCDLVELYRRSDATPPPGDALLRSQLQDLLDR